MTFIEYCKKLIEVATISDEVRKVKEFCIE
jgi:hypothetical protein